MADVPVSRMWKSSPASRAVFSVWPTAATCGSVKTTCGDALAVGAVLGGRRVAEDVLARQPRLVLAHVGEQDAAVDVADRVQPVVAGDLHVLVDLDVVAALQPDALEPELLGARVTPERGDELLGVHGRAVVHVHRERVAVLHDLGGLAAGADVDAVLDERVRDLLAGELLHVGEQPALALDQRHLGAERAVRLRQLGAEHAAAEDHDRLGDVLGGGGLAVGPRLGLAQALDRRQQGARAAGQDHGRRASSWSSPTSTRFSPASTPKPR